MITSDVLYAAFVKALDYEEITMQLRYLYNETGSKKISIYIITDDIYYEYNSLAV